MQSSRFAFNGGASLEAIIASEKEVWSREKAALQKSLKRAEAEVCKLKAELRNDALLQNLSPDSEHIALKVGRIFRLSPRCHCSCPPPSAMHPQATRD